MLRRFDSPRLFGWDHGKCEALVGGGPSCWTCGDGICEFNFTENICNCPQDCKKPHKECAEEGEFIEKPENHGIVWSNSWFPEKCCKGLKPVDRGWPDNGSICSRQ